MESYLELFLRHKESTDVQVCTSERENSSYAPPANSVADEEHFCSA